MKTDTKLHSIALASALIFIILFLSTASASSVTITSLGTLPGGSDSRAYGINDEGQIVGMTNPPSANYHAFLWENGVMTDIGALYRVHSTAQDINNNGQIVGYNDTSSAQYHAFLWENGAMTDIGTLSGRSESCAYGINDNGQIVGFSDTLSTNYRAFLWENGVMTDLGTLPGGSYSEAYSINNKGQIVGRSISSGYPRAFLWENGVMTDLGTLPGGSASEAYGINNKGQIVGWSYNESDRKHAFLWENGVMTDLGTLPGGSYSEAYDINDNGQIVGYSRMNTYDTATLWTLPKTTPTIFWSAPSDITAGTALDSKQLNAITTDPNTGNSVPGIFTYNPEEGTVLDVGTHTLHMDFTPSDPSIYNTASAYVQINVLPVPLKTPTITWDNPADITVGTELDSTQLNAAATDPVSGAPVAGTFTYNPAAGNVLSAGMGQTLHVYFVPTDTSTYNAASKDVTINVLKATPVIIWNSPTDIVSGTPLNSTQLNAVVSVPGTFTYTPPAGTILGAGTHTLHVDFTPTDIANYTTASQDVTINVLEKPVIPIANFSASPTEGKAPLTVTFTDSSTGSPTSWSWNFGDKNISTDKNSVHKYNKQGKYTVSLTVENTAGSNTKTIKKYITVKKK